MHEALRVLVDDVLGLEEVATDLFRGRSPQGATRPVFGGQLAAQALAAATRTVPPGRAAHSLHAYFLRPGDPAVPIMYQVEHLRDGRTFTTRRVTAVQHRRPIFTAMVQLTVPDSGPQHVDPTPDAPEPETVPLQSPLHLPRPGGPTERWAWGESLDLRWAVGGPDAPPRRDARHQVWFTTVDRLPDDPALHACVLAYASDLTILVVAIAPHDDVTGGFGPAALQVGSLDHTIWFHGPARADEWLLYDQASPWADSGRALATGTIWTRDGRRVATVAQEGFLRFPVPPSPPGATP